MLNAESAFARELWEKRTSPCPILDFHAHMHELGSIALPAAQPEQMVHSMDRYGTRWTLFCSHQALTNPLVGERLQQEAVRRFPDRLRAYHSVFTLMPNHDAAIREIDDNPDVYVGCKFLCDYMGVRVDDERNLPFFRHINDKRLLALIHTWSGSPFSNYEIIGGLAEKYPDATFICGHSFFTDFGRAYQRLRDLPNIYFELTAVPGVRGLIEEICEKAGSERLLFGTDLPWFSTIHSVGCLADADISDADRENILYRNGDKLLRRFAWYQPIA